MYTSSKLSANLPEGGVKLNLFAHQVGGHSCILTLHNDIVCKPLNQREHQFYETMPSELEDFTPQYKGESTLCYYHLVTIH